MTYREWLGSHLRPRQALGYGATLLAAVAAVASNDYGSDYCEVSLPDEAVVLDTNHQDIRRQFVVESNDGVFDVRVAFTAKGVALPGLELRTLGPTVASVEPSYHTEDSRTQLIARVRVDCPDEFPCVGRFEVRAAITTAYRVEGTFSVSAERDDCLIRPPDNYLAIQPL